LWHKLEHADNKTDDSETTDASTVDLVEAPHGKQLLDNDHQLRGFREIALPGMESVYGPQP
jgi:hypothetical protein